MDMTKLIVAFYNFGKAPRNVSLTFTSYYTLGVKKNYWTRQRKLISKSQHENTQQTLQMCKVRLFDNDIKKPKFQA
jgi:hypothetical protein